MSHLIFSRLFYCFVEEVAQFLLKDPAPVLSVLIPIQLEKDLVIWEWWLTPIILALKKRKAEGRCIFKASLGLPGELVSSEPAGLPSCKERLCLKKKKRKKENDFSLSDD